MLSIRNNMYVYPLKPHIYIAKLGYGGVYRFFIILLQNIDCWYHVLSKNKIIIKRFLVKIFNFYNFGKTCILLGGGGGGREVVVNFVFSRDQMRTHPDLSSLTKLLHCIVTVYLFIFFYFLFLFLFLFFFFFFFFIFIEISVKFGLNSGDKTS